MIAVDFSKMTRRELDNLYYTSLEDLDLVVQYGYTHTQDFREGKEVVLEIVSEYKRRGRRVPHPLPEYM